MKNIITVLFLCFTAAAFGQSSRAVSDIDFVKIKNGKKAEALYFYENNWKFYREIALQKGYIKSYKFFTAKPDSLANFDIVMVTEYADSIQFKKSEENFNKIIKETRPNGAKLLNDLKPADFRINLYGKIAESLYQGGQ